MSKFSGILAAKRELESEIAPEPERQSSTEKKKPGRPPAKRSDPDFVQTSPYIRRETLRKVKMQLLLEGQGREYSELVEELLSKWLKTQITKNAE